MRLKTKFPEVKQKGIEHDIDSLLAKIRKTKRDLAEIDKVLSGNPENVKLRANYGTKKKALKSKIARLAESLETKVRAAEKKH